MKRALAPPVGQEIREYDNTRDDFLNNKNINRTLIIYIYLKKSENNNNNIKPIDLWIDEEILLMMTK